jgi:hypothetical protein
MSDEILREIHAIKDASGARFASVAALARELATQERKSAALGRTLIALPLRRSKIGQAKPPAGVDRRELSV